MRTEFWGNVFGMSSTLARLNTIHQTMNVDCLSAEDGENQLGSLTTVRRILCTAQILNDKYWPLLKHAGAIFSFPTEHRRNSYHNAKCANQSNIDGNSPKKMNLRRRLTIFFSLWLLRCHKANETRAGERKRKMWNFFRYWILIQWSHFVQFRHAPNFFLLLLISYLVGFFHTIFPASYSIPFHSFFILKEMKN